MTILFGHPSGTPFAYHCALAHFEAGELESFCVPWMPSSVTLRLLERFRPIRPVVQRLSRRYFQPLAYAPKTQGRLREMRRLLIRGFGFNAESLPIEANEWLMRTMARNCSTPRVTAVHAYEDCSLRQFRKAKRLGKACIYDMPIGYYAAWERARAKLERKYRDWMLAVGSVPVVSPLHKHDEMDLADLVLAPSEFVADTIREFHNNKTIAVIPYGIDIDDQPDCEEPVREALTFLFVGQCSVRKGVPLLLRAWQAAGLKGARLQLVGSWGLAAEKMRQLPAGSQWIGPVSRQRVKQYYRKADVFVFPSNFEGRALAAGEALSAGLPVLTTRESGISDQIDDSCGRIIPADNLEALVEGLRWFASKRNSLVRFKVGAKAMAARSRWESYRRQVTVAVQPYLSAGGARLCNSPSFSH